jgi:pimeloyl-ACP methyl ester carboxylesterase
MVWLIGAAISAVVLVGAAFTAYVLIWYMPIIVKIFEEGQILPPPPTGFRLEGEPVTFSAADETPLRGMMLKSQKPNGRTILFCHEYGSDMHSFPKYGRTLSQAGFHVFAFDFRGHGRSSETNGYVPRQWVTDKEINDILGAIEYLKTRHDVDADNLGIFGISRGAGAGICAASRCRNIKAVVADSAFSTELTLEQYMKKWVSIYAQIRIIYRNLPDLFYAFLGFVCRKLVQRRLKCRFPSVERCAKRIAPKPLYMIYGEKDTYVGMDQAKDLFGRARQPKELWVVPGARHNESATIADEEYADNVAQFFTETLCHQPRKETG